MWAFFHHCYHHERGLLYWERHGQEQKLIRPNLVNHKRYFTIHSFYGLVYNDDHYFLDQRTGGESAHSSLYIQTTAGQPGLSFHVFLSSLCTK